MQIGYRPIPDVRCEDEITISEHDKANQKETVTHRTHRRTQIEFAIDSLGVPGILAIMVF